MMKKLLFAALLLSVVTISCKDETETGGGNAIVITNTTDKGVDDIITRAVGDDYYLKITGPEGYLEELRPIGTNRTFSDLAEGEYTVLLRNKETYTTPFLNQPIYEGSLTQPVTGTTPFSITCKQINVGIRFVFDASVTTYYNNPVATLTKVGEGTISLTPADQGTNIAYFDPGTIRLTLADDDGEIKIGGQSYKDLETIARQLWTITLKTSNIPGSDTGDIVLDIEVDTGTDSKDEELELGEASGTGSGDSPFSVSAALKRSLPTPTVWVEGYILGSTSLTRAGGEDNIVIGHQPNLSMTEGIVVGMSADILRAKMQLAADAELKGLRIALKGVVAEKTSGSPAMGKAMMTGVDVEDSNNDNNCYSLNFFTDLKKSVNYYCLNNGMENTTLKNAGPNGLKIGAAVRHEQLVWPYGWNPDPTYINILKRDFNSITAEYTMKMDWIWQAENNFKFDDADNLVAFAEANGMRVHGHTLIWPEVVPGWLKAITADSKTQEEWEALMVKYIKTVVTHFAGKVASWDVANESFSDQDGTLWGTNTTNNDFWYKRVGPDFIKIAFTAAREALNAADDTKCVLLYNDYDIVSNSVKRQGICNYFAGLLAEGVPVDGIGTQSHVNVRPDYAEAKAAYAQLAALKKETGEGIMIHLSELDAIINNTPFIDGNNGGIPFTEYTSFTADYAQGKSFNMMARAYLDNVPEAQRFGITTWGITDRYSMTGTNRYGHKDWPVLFDKSNKPKRAYHGLLEALLGVDWEVKDNGGSNWNWRVTEGYEK